MTPKAYMITGLNKKGLWTEYSNLELEHKDLMLTLISFSLPEFGLMCKAKMNYPIILNRDIVQKAINKLHDLMNFTTVASILNMLKPVEYKYNLPSHGPINLNDYSIYCNLIQKFLKTGYLNAEGSTFDLIIL